MYVYVHVSTVGSPRLDRRGEETRTAILLWVFMFLDHQSSMYIQTPRPFFWPNFYVQSTLTMVKFSRSILTPGVASSNQVSISLMSEASPAFKLGIWTWPLAWSTSIFFHRQSIIYMISRKRGLKGLLGDGEITQRANDWSDWKPKQSPPKYKLKILAADYGSISDWWRK